MSEQFTLEQLFRYRTHIKRHHILFIATRQPVYLTCKQLLSRTVLASNEYVGIGHRHTLHHSTYVLHLGTRTPEHRNLFAHRSNHLLALILGTVESIHQRLNHLLVVPWLYHKVKSTMLHSPHGKVNVGIGSEEHHPQLRKFPLSLLEPEYTLIATVYASVEVHIQQQHIGLLSCYCRKQGGRRRKSNHLREMAVGKQFHRRQDIPIIINYK